jgi:uncharacterized membrane protein
LISYPLLPWIGVIAAGFSYGAVQALPIDRRVRITRALGLCLIVAFFLIRAVNVYGNPRRWTMQKDTLFTLLSFLSVEKYPPSLTFVLMTLGPALLAFSFFESATLPAALKPLIVFGRVPLFFYVTHLFLLRYVSGVVAFARFGPSAFNPPPGHAGSPEFDLWVSYVVWGAAVITLFPLCRWFAGVKQRRRAWWLSYL